MSRSFAWLLVLLLFGVFAGAVAFVLRARAEGGKGMPPYSVFSHAKYRGASEADHVLRDAGWKTVPVTRPIQYAQAAGLLILVQPEEDDAPDADDPTGGVSDDDAKAMLRWVGQGNTLLLMSKKANGLHRVLDLIPTTRQRGADYVRATLDPDLSSSYGYGYDIHVLSVATPSTLPDRSGALPLWRVGGGPGALVVRQGQGRVILVADPSLATYDGLWAADGRTERRDDNLMFLVNVAAMYGRGGTVYFDEYHHGFQTGGGFWGYLREHGQHLLLIPLFLAVGAGLWTWAVRLGPATPTPQTTEADAVDYASALARLYRQAGARRRLARTLARGFLGALTRQLRIRRNALPAEILSAWRQHDPGESGDRLQALLHGAAELRRGDVTEEQLMRWSQGFGEFLQEMEVAERGRMGLKAKARRR